MTESPTAPDRDERSEDSDEYVGGATSAEDVEADGPLDADEGDPQTESYPG